MNRENYYRKLRDIMWSIRVGNNDFKAIIIIALLRREVIAPVLVTGGASNEQRVAVLADRIAIALDILSSRLRIGRQITRLIMAANGMWARQRTVPSTDSLYPYTRSIPFRSSPAACKVSSFELNDA